MSAPVTLCWRNRWTSFSDTGVDDPVVLLGDDDSSVSEAEVDDSGLCAESAALDGLFDSTEITVDSTDPGAPPSSDGWHDINDFLETASRLPLAQQRVSTSNSIHPPTPPSRLSSELLETFRTFRHPNRKV